jgi:hypothetical protein
VNRAKLILSFVALLAVYHTAGAIFGRDAKLYFLIGLIVVSCLLSLITFILKRRLHDQSPDSAVFSADHTSDFDSECDDIIPVPGPRLRGIRRYIDGVIGLATAFGPPLLVSVFRGDRLSWDSAFTGYHVLAMFTGFALYCCIRPWIWRSRSR